MTGHRHPAPRVAVVIPTYNRAALVCDAIGSVLAQSFRDFEIVVVDNGSTDDTARVVPARFGREPRLRLLRRDNAGPGAGRNHGVRHSTGELIAFLDSDDLWDPEKLALQVELLDRHPEAAMAFCDARTEDRRGNPGTRFRSKGFTGDTTMRGIIESDFPMCTPATMIRRGDFDALGGFDESFHCGEDWDLWIRVRARYPIVYVDRPLITIRRGEDSISRGNQLDKWRSWLRLWEKHRDLLLRSGCPERLVRRRLGHAHKKIAQESRARGEGRSARVHYIEWWRRQPARLDALLAWMALGLHRDPPGGSNGTRRAEQ